ncbi:hypothetical protein CU098_008190, partial [Rhizopus stolonifer]
GQYFLAPVLVPSNQLDCQLYNTHFTTAQPIAQSTPFVQPDQQQERPGEYVFRGTLNARQITTIWLILKLAIVLFIMCQGASIEQMILYHLIALVFLMYQTGRLRVIIRRIQPEPRPTEGN